MNDVYVEYSFDVEIPIYKKIVRNLLIALAVLLILYSMFFPILLSFGIFMLLMAYLYHRNMRFEYEYILYNDELDFYKIIDKRKRKKLFTVNLLHLEGFMRDHQENTQYSKMKKYCSFKQNKQVYKLIVKEHNKKVCVFMNASEMLIDGLKQRHGLKIKV